MRLDGDGKPGFGVVDMTWATLSPSFTGDCSTRRKLLNVRWRGLAVVVVVVVAMVVVLATCTGGGLGVSDESWLVTLVLLLSSHESFVTGDGGLLTVCSLM